MFSTRFVFFNDKFCLVLRCRRTQQRDQVGYLQANVHTPCRLFTEIPMYTAIEKQTKINTGVNCTESILSCFEVMQRVELNILFYLRSPKETTEDIILRKKTFWLHKCQRNSAGTSFLLGCSSCFFRRVTCTTISAMQPLLFLLKKRLVGMCHKVLHVIHGCSFIIFSPNGAGERCDGRMVMVFEGAEFPQRGFQR